MYDIEHLFFHGNGSKMKVLIVLATRYDSFECVVYANSVIDAIQKAEGAHPGYKWRHWEIVTSKAQTKHAKEKIA